MFFLRANIGFFVLLVGIYWKESNVGASTSPPPVDTCPEPTEIAPAGIRDIVKNAEARLTSEYLRMVNDHIRDNIGSVVQFQVLERWADKVKPEPPKEVDQLENIYPLCYTQYKDGVNSNDGLARDMALVGSDRTCGPTFCKAWKRTLDATNKCNDPKIDSPSGGFFVDELNTRCQLVRSKLRREIFKDVCLCAYADRTNALLVAYLLFEEVSNRGIYNYHRLSDRTYTYQKNKRERFYDLTLRRFPLSCFAFSRAVQYRNLFKTYEQINRSTCKRGIFTWAATPGQ